MWLTNHRIHLIKEKKQDIAFIITILELNKIPVNKNSSKMSLIVRLFNNWWIECLFFWFQIIFQPLYTLMRTFALQLTTKGTFIK